MVPAQIALAGFAEMLTLATTFGVTVMFIAFDVPGFPITQTAFEIISQVITSPLFKDDVINVGLERGNHQQNQHQARERVHQIGEDRKSVV